MTFSASFGYKEIVLTRVEHLHVILGALAIQVCNPQNALAQISFHSPKSLPPPPSAAFLQQLTLSPHLSHRDIDSLQATSCSLIQRVHF